MLSPNHERLIAQKADLAFASTVKAYYSITKPGIVGLTLVAALTGIFVATRGVFSDWQLVAWLFVSLGLATSGSCMLNNVYDQDIDRQMGRTRKRALASGAISPRVALIIGLALAILPLFLMAATVNVPAALLTAGAVFGYVVVYSMVAKRRTPWANQLGGIAGALPPVIGYAAATGGVDIYAFILFLIMAVWQQPHALSLALKYREDYARAGVPVIPVAKGVRATKIRIAVYTAALLPIVVLPYSYGLAGMFYLLTAVAVTLVFLAMAVRFLLSERDYDMRLFFFSLVHLIAVFGSLVWDIQPGLGG